MALRIEYGSLGHKAPDFNLMGIDGEQHSLATQTKVLLFLCNHCPYVQKSGTICPLEKRMPEEQFVGINANGANPDYPKTPSRK